MSATPRVGGCTVGPYGRRELDDIYSLVLRAAAGADEHAAGELRAALAELSRSRARSGFTPSETALAVFSLKGAVYELVADVADMVPEFLAFSRLIDDLGLHTFETYVTAREWIIADQSTSMMELSTPVVRLWDGIIAVPLVGTLDSARTQRRRDGPGRHAPGGGDHADRARPVAARRAHRAERGEGPGAAERKLVMDELPIQSGDDVVRVRQHVRVVAAQNGLSLVDFTDEGPGIADIDLALTDGWTSGSGLGLGLSGARRLVDELELTSKPGGGTSVVVVRRAPSGSSTTTCRRGQP